MRSWLDSVHAFMKYYNEKWDDVMGMQFEQFLFRLNEMILMQEREVKAAQKAMKKR